jgi:uncharacterized membrane protein (Fun14 family)
MSTENLTSGVTILGSSFLVSFLIGYFLKKIIKLLMFIFGGILALLMYMQSQEILDVEVDVNKIQSSAEAVINTIATNTTSIIPTDNNNLSILGSNLGIPLTGSIASGFMLGVTRRG